MTTKYDIKSGYGYPSCELSNYAHHQFVFDGIQIGGMEGLLQSFKFNDVHEQRYVCSLSGRIAWKYGQSSKWFENQTLYWNGQQYNRHGNDYQLLLDNAYNALCSNSNFVKALLDTHDWILTHEIGDTNPHKTILTAQEFCSRLTHLRMMYQFDFI